MKTNSKSLSEQAVQRLEETGYLKKVRAEMKAEVMKCLIEMEKNDELPSHLKIKKFTPPDDDNLDALAYIAEFMKFHGLEHSLTCLQAEVNGKIPEIKGGGSHSELASAILQKDRKNINPLLDD